MANFYNYPFKALLIYWILICGFYHTVENMQSLCILATKIYKLMNNIFLFLLQKLCRHRNFLNVNFLFNYRFILYINRYFLNNKIINLNISCI